MNLLFLFAFAVSPPPAMVRVLPVPTAGYSVIDEQAYKCNVVMIGNAVLDRCRPAPMPPVPAYSASDLAHDGIGMERTEYGGLRFTR